MNKNQIIKETEKIVEDIIEKSEINYELIEVDWEKESGSNYLRVYVDKEGGISVEDCAELSRQINKILDLKFEHSEKYFLEVSSPGIFRAFARDKDYSRNIGNEVEIKTYKKIEENKTFTGVLKKFDTETVWIETDNGKKMEISRNNIAKICRHIIF